MASSAIIHLTPSNKGTFSVPNVTQASAALTTKLLQENHEKHHIFFNSSGFHNHIAHHLLTLFALGASPDLIRRHYANNSSYQRPPQPIDKDLIDGKLRDPTEFSKYLGDERYYHDYLIFFQREMDRLPGGYRDVVREYLLKGDERANDLLGRAYNGILHPLIHLGFGVEFEQPAIVAEALAQAAVHGDWLTRFLLDAEVKAGKGARKGEEGRTLVQLLGAIRADEKLRKAPRWEDGNKLRDGVFARAYDEMVAYAAQWRVEGGGQLEQKTAEMYDFCAFFAGAAQKPPKAVKFDFFYIHSLNCSVFFAAFLGQDWLSTEEKIRLLEWKARVDLAEYVRSGLAELRLDEVEGYEPKQADQSSWEQVFRRVNEHDDDGHASKLVRALAKGNELAERFEKDGDFQIRGDSWLKEANMAIDSVDAGGPSWVFNCGYDQAWGNVPERSQARL